MPMISPFRHALGYRGVRLLSRGVLGALGIDVEHRGPVPGRGALLVANHLSWIDIVAAMSKWRCTFVAKREVRDWPLVGRLAHMLGVIFIDRARPRDLLRVIPEIERALARGERVLLFAEGTTSRGRVVLPFRSALLEAAVRAGAPVFPVAVRATAERGDADALAWYGDETLVANIRRVARMHRPRFTLHVGAPLHGEERKSMSRSARAEVVRRFHPVAIAARPADSSLRTAGDRSVLLKQNLRPIDSSDREIFV